MELDECIGLLVRNDTVRARCTVRNGAEIRDYPEIRDRSGGHPFVQRGPSPALALAETSFSHGAEWKAVISTYIGTMPVSGNAGCAGMHSMAEVSLPRRLDSSA